MNKLLVKETIFAVFGVSAFLWSTSLEAALLVRYDFNESSGAYANSGTTSTTASISAVGGINGAHGADGSGVSGAAGDRAFDNSAAMETAPNVIAGGVVRQGSDVDALDTLSAMTITGWYNSSEAFTGNQRMIDNSNFTTTTIGYQMFGITSGSNFSWRMIMGDGVAPTVNIDSTVFGTGTGFNQVGSWVFYAFTWDGTNANWYFGDTATTVAAAGSGTYNLTLGGASNTRALDIGNTGIPRAFDGFIDDTRIYDNALTLGELDTVRLEAVPEPSSYALFALGGVVLYGLRRLQKKS